MSRASLRQENKPVFNPQASYRWEPNDIIEIWGEEFANLYHLLKDMVNKPEGVPIGVIYQNYLVISEIFKRGVESGVIVEVSTVIPEKVEEVDKQVNNLFKKVNPE